MLFSGLIILLELSDNLLFSLLEDMLLLGDLCSDRGLLLNWRLAWSCWRSSWRSILPVRRFWGASDTLSSWWSTTVVGPAWAEGSRRDLSWVLRSSSHDGESLWRGSFLILVDLCTSNWLDCANLLTIDKRLANKLQALTALDHLDNKILLKFLMVLLNVLIELLIASSNLASHIFSLLLEVDAFISHQKQVLFDPNNWNGDVHFLDHSLDLQVNFFTFPGNKFDGSVREKNLALLLDFLVGNSSVVNVTLDEMLISLAFLLFLFQDSKSLCFFKLNPTKFLQKCFLSLISELNQPLSLLLLSLSPLNNH